MSMYVLLFLLLLTLYLVRARDSLDIPVLLNSEINICVCVLTHFLLYI